MVFNYFKDNDRIWNEPLIGYSRGDDDYYKYFKEHIGEYYWTPLEIFKLHHPDIDVKDSDLTVISWILPQT